MGVPPGSILLGEFYLNCLLVIFADQVFIDATFFGIFVCGPVQSFVVNVCTIYIAVTKPVARHTVQMFPVIPART